MLFSTNIISDDIKDWTEIGGSWFLLHIKIGGQDIKQPETLYLLDSGTGKCPRNQFLALPLLTNPIRTSYQTQHESVEIHEPKDEV